MADRGLQAHVVPSARAGRSDPAARLDALAGLMTGGFLLVIVAAVLAIVIAAPQYAEPEPDAPPLALAAGDDATADAAGAPVEAASEITTSKPPGRLKGYRWPVRGGSVHTYYERDRQGRFEIGGERVHDGLLITWFAGAKVKAAHKGTVVAAGRDWVRHAGYDGPLDAALEAFDRGARKRARQGGEKPERYPLGVVIDDGNGYYSVYSELQELRVEAGDVVKAGQLIGEMSRAEGKQMMRYRLVRMDGPMMKVHQSDRKRGYPGYARERVDPLAVLKLDARAMPTLKRQPPADPPRLSDY